MIKYHKKTLTKNDIKNSNQIMGVGLIISILLNIINK